MTLDELGNKPLVFKDYVNNAGALVTWQDVEFCINNPWQYGLNVIHKNLGTRIPIKLTPSFWHGKDVPDKRQVMDKVQQGHTLVIDNFSVHSQGTHKLAKSIEDLFDANCDMHVYCSLEKSSSFGIHCDRPPNFIVQIMGETEWKVFDKVQEGQYNSNNITEQEAGEVLIQTILRPGDMLYIPERMYHQALPFEKRISISIPFPKRDITSNPIDRRQLKLNAN